MNKPGNTATPIAGDGNIVGDDNIAQVIKAEGGSTISNIVQTMVKVYTRSSLEELCDYLAQAVSAYEARMYQALLRHPLPHHPYKFLYSYELEDAPIYFGRDAAIQALHEKVLADRLTVLHARSGAGKTSLLNAGFAPRLISERRLPVYARAYNDPALAVKRAIAPPSLGPWPELLPKLSLHEFLGLACTRLNRQTVEMVIVFDQLEEFFVLPSEPEQHQNFIQTLGDCYEDKSLPARFLIGIRDDYLAGLAEFEERLGHIFHNRYWLRPMNRQEAAAAIREPLHHLNPPRAFEPALLEGLLNDLAKDEMEPPHLQIVCTRLYEALMPGERVITETHYQNLGGVKGILGDYLRHEVEKLGRDVPLARAILAELVTSENTRQALSDSELHERLIQRHDLPRLECVLASLVTARLLQRNEMEGTVRYELAHEHLIEQIHAWVTAEDVQAKQARETMRRALTNWRVHTWLLDETAFAFIHKQRELLSNLGLEETEMLFRSAVAHQAAVDIWALAARRKGIDIWPILQPALSAQDHHVRAAVVALLAVIGEEALPALGQALTDPVPRVRVQAILALDRLNTDQACQTLQDNLQDEVYIPSNESLPGFYIDRYPVTNAAYELFLLDDPDHKSPPYWRGRSAPTHLLEHPVVEVNWQDAQAYAAWAAKRLPTAEEWQWAAGKRAKQHYPWGDQFLSACCNTREARLGSTTPVGMYSPAADSPYGVADLAGNVWEWLVDKAGPGGQYRQLRGGAWFYSADFARIDYNRFWRKPDHRQDVIGFRLCFSVPKSGG